MYDGVSLIKGDKVEKGAELVLVDAIGCGDDESGEDFGFAVVDDLISDFLHDGVFLSFPDLLVEGLSFFF